MGEKVRDFYAILDVEQNATEKDIKKSYRKLASKYHPDVSEEENAVERFKEVQEAYDVLMDKESREEYDAFVRMHKEGKLTEFADVYDQFYPEDIGKYTPVKGADVGIKLDFTVSEVRQLAEKEVEFDRIENCGDCKGAGFKKRSDNWCPVCGGYGFSLTEEISPFGTVKTKKECQRCSGTGFADTEACSTCRGSGDKRAGTTIRFRLPKEAKEGFELKIKGKGDSGINGGPDGDLFVTLTQSKSDPFRIESDGDVSLPVDVSLLTSWDGGKVKVTLPSGETMKVPIAKGTAHGHRIVLPGEGLFNTTSGMYGNVYVVVNVSTDVPEEKRFKLIGILK